MNEHPTLPFAFEPRPVDAIFLNRRHDAHLTSTCSACFEDVDYAALAPRDQAEYRISYTCPACFAALTTAEED